MRTTEEIFRSAIEVKQRILNDSRLVVIADEVSRVLVEVFRGGGRVYFCGNGGSAADAQHFAAELSGHYIFDRPPLSAEVLHGNISHVTAVANDYGYDQVFARALRGSAKTEDMLVAFSTSGNSPSILRAAETAREMGVIVTGLTGEGGGLLAHLTDYLIDVPSQETGRIQEAHAVFIHAISERVEHLMFGR